MRIEERCRCGAELRLTVDLVVSKRLVDLEQNYAAERAAWRHVDRWRRLHAGCRSDAAASVKAFGEELDRLAEQLGGRKL